MLVERKSFKAIEKGFEAGVSGTNVRVVSVDFFTPVRSFRRVFRITNRNVNLGISRTCLDVSYRKAANEVIFGNVVQKMCNRDCITNAWSRDRGRVIGVVDRV